MDFTIFIPIFQINFVVFIHIVSDVKKYNYLIWMDRCDVEKFSVNFSISMPLYTILSIILLLY